MTKYVLSIFLLFLFTAPQFLWAQTNAEKAHQKGSEAVKLMDRGAIEESLKLLKEAKKLDPKNIIYPYEEAYAHILKKDYETAIKILEKLKKHKDVFDQVYQTLGNSYSMNGQRDKAIDTYEKGISLFPKSGRLYLERGNMEMFVENYLQALSFYEKGIELDPKFPSNYFWAAKIYCSSSEEVWGMIYGEIFMNLERNTKRTAEISKLLFDTYKSEITFSSDTSYSVSFSKNATVTISDPSDIENIKLPFGIMVYEPLLILAIGDIRTINIGTLNQIRSAFVDYFFSGEHHQNYPNVLLSYQKQLNDSGHLEAYNHWILMKGDDTGFNNWQSENTEKWDAFVNWFGQNGLVINESNKFHSENY